MKKIFLGFLFIAISGVVQAAPQTPYEAPEILENACYDGQCTQAMLDIYQSFLSTPQAPKYIPGMYSGICYHKSQYMDPEINHYVGLFIDRMDDGQSHYMAPIMQYFGGENMMSDWTLEMARKESSPDWKKYGPMKVHPTSATQFVLDSEQYPVYIYWARQNTQTKTIYFLSLARGFGVAFCEAHPNEGGLE